MYLFSFRIYDCKIVAFTTREAVTVERFCPFFHTPSKFHATRIAHVALNFRYVRPVLPRRSVLVSGIRICRLSSLAYRCVGVFSLGAERDAMMSLPTMAHHNGRFCSKTLLSFQYFIVKKE